MNNSKNVLILVLVAAVAILGYLYYESRQSAVVIDAPGFKLEAR